MDSSKSILEAIVLGSPKVLEDLYRECFPPIKQLVLKNSGRIEDAEDIFQEALIVLYRQIRDQRLELRCALSTYIYSICRNMWLDRLRRERKSLEIVDLDVERIDLDADVLEAIYKSERFTLYQKHLKLIQEECQKLLSLFFMGKKMKEITQQMNYRNESYTRKQKFKCKEKLIERIKQDPLYKQIA